MTYNQCNVTLEQKIGLENHLLSHENKQFKCPHKGCFKTFNTKDGLNQHKVVDLKNTKIKGNAKTKSLQLNSPDYN